MEFEVYVGQARRALLRFAVVLTDDPELAQDVVHDVLLKAQQQWSRVSAADNPHAYVRRMLANEVVSWRRKWSRIEARPDHHLDRFVPDPTHNVDRRDALLREIAVLPIKQRAALVMRFFEDMPDAEIADVLGCSESTVRVHVHRALAALRVDAVIPAFGS